MVVVVLGLYVFFHLAGDSKDGGTPKRAVQSFLRRDSNPGPLGYKSDPYHLSYPVPRILSETVLVENS